jgi:hypothetical protein
MKLTFPPGFGSLLQLMEESMARLCIREEMDVCRKSSKLGKVTVSTRRRKVV